LLRGAAHYDAHAINGLLLSFTLTAFCLLLSAFRFLLSALFNLRGSCLIYGCSFDSSVLGGATRLTRRV